MIRIILILCGITAVFIGLILFPQIASQPVRIEMLGWLFETRTGMFILLLLFILACLWSAQKLFNLSINSPRQLWSNLRSGNRKRRELHLQEALATWIDEGQGHSQKLLKRSKNVVPNWLYESLFIWLDKPESHTKIDDDKDSALLIALKARLATNPEYISSISLSERQQYLDHWLAVHPAAPLAMKRKATVLGELGEFTEQVTLLESLWNKKYNIETTKPLLATALRLLAKQEPKNKLAYLRKANRINPNDTEVLTDLALALAESGDLQSAARLLLDHLEQHDAMHVAETAFALLSDQALKHFKLVDKSNLQQHISGNWLRLSLAHKADLVGIAEDGLNALLERSPSAKLWQVRGDWFAEKQQWEKAVSAYQKAQTFM